MAVPKIHVYDDDRKRIKTVDNADTFTWNRKWRGIDTWSLKINSRLPNADYFLENGYVGYYRQGQYRLGMIEYWNDVEGEKASDDMIEFQGRGIEMCLAGRFLQNFRTLGTEYDTQAAGAYREAAVRHYVDVEAITAPTGWPIENLSLEVLDPAVYTRGGTLSADYNGRLQALPDTINDIYAAATPYPLGWDVLFTPSTSPPTDPGTLMFRTLSPRVNTTVVLSAKFHTTTGMTASRNLMDQKNYGLVGGSGSGTSRIFREVSDGSGATGIKRRAAFLEESSCSTNDELDQAGATRLLEYAAVTSIEAEYYPEGSFRYITDFDLGDIITAESRSKRTVATTTIVGVDEVYSRSGEQIKLTLGTKKPDMIDLSMRDRKQYLAQVRR